MSGHRHNPTAGTQNQGNSLGDRSCVRQSKLYRMYESGNGVKDALGSGHLAWDTNYKQGAYAGQKVFDHMSDNGYSREDNYGSRGSNNYSSNNYSQRNNDENNYPSKNTLSHYARGDDYSGGAARGIPSYDNDYAPKNAAGGRGNSSGGGPSSFMIGQTSYSHNDDYASKSNFNRRTSHEPVASGDDCYPMNKMGGGRAPIASEDSYRGRPPMPDNDHYPSNKMSGRSNSGHRRVEDEDDNYPLNKMNQQGSYRSLKDQMNYNSNNSNFQPTRTKSSEMAADRVARSYFPPQQQDRSTRSFNKTLVKTIFISLF